MKKLCLVLLLVVPVFTSPAQTINLSGQIRERSEVNGRVFTQGWHTDAFHLLRSRLKAAATLNANVAAVIEVQDAREFGGRSSTLNTGALSFDVRQAFVEMKDSGAVSWQARIGRQVLSFANERLLGAIEWNNYGQSFDAASVRFSMSDVALELVGASITRTANSGTTYNRDYYMTAAMAAWRPAWWKGSVQAMWLFDNPRTPTGYQNRHTVALHASGNSAGFDYELEGALQMGDYMVTGQPPFTIDANMVGARLGYTFADLAKLRIGVGFDRLSGADPKSSDTFGAFSTLYGTNHKFYGHMDYFTVFPNYATPGAPTGYGLQDIIGQVSIVPCKASTLGVDVHLFSAVTDPKDWVAGSTDVKTIGMEVDLYGSVKVFDAVAMTGGVSIFDGDRDRPVYKGRKTTNWAWLMTTVNL